MSHRFVHLNNHTNYSLLEGMLKNKKISELCIKDVMPAVGITDTNNMFGVLEFSEHMMNNGIQPIIGTQISIFYNKKISGKLVLLAQTQKGYQNLLKISSKSYLEPQDHHHSLSLEQIENISDGIICLTGGINGLIGKLINEYSTEKQIEQALESLIQIFPKALYIELQRHNLEIEKKLEPIFLNLSKKFSIPVVATNECLFPHKDQEEAAKILAGIGNHDTSNITSEHYFKTQQEMVDLFSDIPIAIRNTINIARSCSAYVPTSKPMLPKFADDENKELIKQAKEGLQIKLEDKIQNDYIKDEEQYFLRLNYELEVINKMGFAGYFLIVADFINWAKKNKVSVGPGRGSGAGSLVAWALSITEIDPIKFGLIFERFLNPDRISMPDFDIDFCPEKRDEVIDYVSEKYGRNQVAQIATFGTLQPRAAVRDVGRVLGIPYTAVDRICKMMPNNPNRPMNISEIIEHEPLIRSAMQEDDQIEKMIKIAEQLEGLYRHASTHAAGVVISNRPLEEISPLYKDDKDDSKIITTQFNMKSAELSGLVKFDFLGLKTLTIINRTIKIVNKEIDINRLKLDDQHTYEEIFHKGLTAGIFQFESQGMTQVAKEIKPTHIDEIIAILALYRPGPMDNIPEYIAVKFGKKKQQSIHPLIDQVTKETNGIIVYQEQVMEIARQFAGYTLGQADLLRRAMGKKIKSEMDAQKNIFISGAKEKSIKPEIADKVFRFVEKFAEYGFNKSHSASYAIIAYQTAWLKAHYPVEFITAFLQVDVDNTDKLILFKNEMSKIGIKLLPPSINHSEENYSVEEKSIRCGLLSIKGMGQEISERIVLERKQRGKFTDISSFSKRIPELKKNHILSLAASGALDEIFPERGKIYNGYEIIIKNNQPSIDLFSFSTDKNIEIELKKQNDWTEEERAIKEISCLGIYNSDQPFTKLAEISTQLGLTSLKNLENIDDKDNRSIFIGGSIIDITFKRNSKSGNRYAFIKLDDTTQIIELISWDEEKNREIKPGMIRFFSIEKQNNKYLIIRSFTTNDFLSRKNKISIETDDQEILKTLSKFIANQVDNNGVGIEIKFKNEKLLLPNRILLTEDFLYKLDKIIHKKAIYTLK